MGEKLTDTLLMCNNNISSDYITERAHTHSSIHSQLCAESSHILQSTMDSVVTSHLRLLPLAAARRSPGNPHAPASFHCFRRSPTLPRLRGFPPLLAANTLSLNSVSPRDGLYTVGDFMTKKDELHVVKPTTSVEEALEILVEHRITGFPVIDDDWNLVGVVSDYDLLALDSISGAGHGRKENNMFPEVDSTWKTFNEVQKLLSKTNGKSIGELMTSAPMVVRETTNLEDAARLLLETKFRRLPVVDAEGRLVGIITRGNVVRAALHIKRAHQKEA